MVISERNRVFNDHNKPLELENEAEESRRLVRSGDVFVRVDGLADAAGTYQRRKLKGFSPLPVGCRPSKVNSSLPRTIMNINGA